MRFGILGATRAWRDDGSEVPLGGPARRALLALLLVRPGTAVTVDSLLEELYSGSPPGGAVHALQSQVTRLRRLLGAAAIELLPAGYRLDAGPGDVDAGRFELLAGQGRQHLDAARPAEAAAILGDALALWRGTAFADLPDAAGARAHALRLEERRLAAVEDRLAARIALGEHGPASAELRELVAHHPLRERLHELLMRALDGAGRPAEALAAYESLRRTLADELGADPSSRLATVHTGLLRGTVHTGPLTDAVHTGQPGTVHTGPLHGTATGTVPAPLTSFVGRDDDLRRVAELLDRARLVTLHGPGGVGKTRLCVEAAARRTDAVFVPLAALRHPAELPSAILSALGLRDDGAIPPLERLAAAFAGRPALLVLDNCEHLVQPAAELAERLLTRCPGLRILATSREPLGVTGEHLWPVRPLAPAPAARLFADRARAVRPDLAPGADTVARICRLLDGLPLAIELAAGRVRTLDPDALADRLTDRFAALSRGSRTAEPRHRTLEAAVAWSWDLLTAAERAALRRLSVFAGGAAAPAAAAVCAVPDAADVLDALADKSLLTTAAGRYGMLETVRAFGRRRLAEAGEEPDAARAHAEFFVELAGAADPHLRGADQLAWLQVLDAEQDNLRAALRWSVAAGEPAQALRLFAFLAMYFWMSGTREPAAAQAVLLLDRIGTRPPPGLSQEYAMCALIAAGSVTGRTAWPRHRAAVERILSDVDRAAHPFTTLLWSMAAYSGDPAAAYSAGPQAVLELAGRERDAPDPWQASAARLVRGFPQLVQHGPAAAEREFTAAAESFRSLGERWGAAMALGSLAGLADLRGDHATAATLAGEAVELTRRLGAQEDLCDLLCDRADYAMRSSAASRPPATSDRSDVDGAGSDGAGSDGAGSDGAGSDGAGSDGAGSDRSDLERARTDYDEAARLAAGAGLAAARGAALRGLADTARLTGDRDTARRLYDEALADLDPHGARSAANRAAALLGLGHLAAAAFGPAKVGDGVPGPGFGPPEAGFGPPEAGFGPVKAGFGSPDAGFGPVGAGFGSVEASFGPAEAGSDPVGARERYRQAAEVAVAAGLLPWAARAVDAVAGLALREGDPSAAATLLGAATALRGTADTSGDPEAARCAADARRRLGDAAFAAAYDRGASLGHADALRLAGVPDSLVAASLVIALGPGDGRPGAGRSANVGRRCGEPTAERDADRR
ncbi:AfsR/SARP family transcriptional regulator [Dactylosporangium sp. CA-092794]|uniref:AfsR/SARP family transcriptional regulator n=1 Tax=Dactylosporangium sp. CA-092794 TaxID=3239929 RepID=UPI003D8E43F1